MTKRLPHCDYHQFQRVQGLTRQRCNNDGGNCLLLDDNWEPCVCVQSISRSLVCKYFRAAVLPLDRELETALLHKNAAAGAGRCSCRAPTEENTARTALSPSIASRRPSANGGAGPSVDS